MKTKGVDVKSLSVGVWHHIKLQFNSVNIKYINGKIPLTIVFIYSYSYEYYSTTLTEFYYYYF